MARLRDPRYSTARWRRLREQIIRRDGLRCPVPDCTSDMRLARMASVDHIVEVRDGGAFWDPANLRVICRVHNYTKGIVEGARRHNEPRSPNR